MLRTCIILSLTLNAVLVLWLVWGAPRSGRPLTTSPVATTTVSSAQSQPQSSAGSTHATEAHSSDPAAPPFDWRQVESADYSQYVANLRAVGCPEEVVRDILLADVTELYAGRMKAIWSDRTKRAYWQKAENDRPNREQMEQLKQITQEKGELLQQLVGGKPGQQEFHDLVFLQSSDHYSLQLAFLPPEKRERARQALADSGLHERDMMEMPESLQSDPLERERKRLKDRMEVLAKVLAPEELEELRLRLSFEAQQLRGESRYMTWTPEEFRAVLKVREELAASPSKPRDYYARKKLEAEAVKKILGDARGQDYARSADLTYTWARDAAGRYSLPEEAPTQAWQLKQDAMAAADRIRADAALSAEQRQQALRTLRQQTEANLTQIMGDPGAKMVRRGDGVWLQMLTQPKVAR